MKMNRITFRLMFCTCEFAAVLMFSGTVFATSISVPNAIGVDGFTDMFKSKGTSIQQFGGSESFFWRDITVTTDKARGLTISMQEPRGLNLDGKFNDYHLGTISFGTPDYVLTDREGDLSYARYDVAFGTRLQTFGEEQTPFRLGVPGKFDDFNLIATGVNTAVLRFDVGMSMYILDLNLKITTLRPWADGNEPFLHAFGHVSIPLRSMPPTGGNGGGNGGEPVPEPMSMALLSCGLLGGFVSKRRKNQG